MERKEASTYQHTLSRDASNGRLPPRSKWSFMNRQSANAEDEIMTSWQLIFLQSRVNNGAYDGDYLPAQNWDWPRDTWFQERLYYLRRERTEKHLHAQEIDCGALPPSR